MTCSKWTHRVLSPSAKFLEQQWSVFLVCNVQPVTPPGLFLTCNSFHKTKIQKKPAAPVYFYCSLGCVRVLLHSIPVLLLLNFGNNAESLILISMLSYSASLWRALKASPFGRWQLEPPKERKKKSFQTCGVDQSKLCLISCRPTLLKALLDWYLSFGLWILSDTGIW